MEDYWSEDDVPMGESQYEDRSILKPDIGQFVVFSSTKSKTYNIWTTPRQRDGIKILTCNKIEFDYNIVPALISGLCFIFGIFLCFFGYRFFKFSLFSSGFLFGSLVTYLICLEENILPFEGKIGVSIGAGILCGLITMLVKYVGLFMTGFHVGFLLSCVGLVTSEWFVHVNSKWVPIGTTLLCGIICALLNLYFQKGMTIFSTSIVGACLQTVAVDYVIEQFTMFYFVLDRLKAFRSEAMCWYAWIVFGLWPLISVLGCVAQAQLSGRGKHHYSAPKVSIRRAKYSSQQHAKCKPEIAHQWHRSVPVSHKQAPRRVQGDILAKNYIFGTHMMEVSK